MTVGVVLLIVVGLIGYELNWVRQRRAAHAEWTRWYYRVDGVDSGLSVRVDVAKVPPLGINRFDKLVVSALDWDWGDHEVPVLCSNEDAKLLAHVPEGEARHEAIMKLERVQHARRLFPEAELWFYFFVDADWNVIPGPVLYVDPDSGATIP